MIKNIFLCLVFVAIISCRTEKQHSISLEDDVTFLASDSLVGRKTGTTEELVAADYIQKRMKAIGLDPKGRATSFYQTFSFKPKVDPHAEVQYGVGDSTITGTNVLGYINNNAEKTVIIGAHYDHLGMGGEGSLYREGNAIHNGADDNASGVSIMLQLAWEVIILLKILPSP